MKLIIQRVKEASVSVDNEEVGSIEKGFLLYVCFEQGDDINTVSEAIDKVYNLRIFEDEKGKMNYNLSQVNGSVLSISQFTLSWDGKKGHRPSFDKSLNPTEAKILYRKFNDYLKEKNIHVELGRFGADMKVSSINDGPVTFHLSF